MAPAHQGSGRGSGLGTERGSGLERDLWALATGQGLAWATEMEMEMTGGADIAPAVSQQGALAISLRLRTSQCPTAMWEPQVENAMCTSIGSYVPGPGLPGEGTI
jgi:hypothetical protein